MIYISKSTPHLPGIAIYIPKAEPPKLSLIPKAKPPIYQASLSQGRGAKGFDSWTSWLPLGGLSD